MPIYDEDRMMSYRSTGDIDRVIDPENEKEQASFTETVGAAFKLDNSVFNVVKENIDIDPELTMDTDFDPWDKLDGYEEFADRFIGASSERDLALIKNEIDFENDQRKVISSAPAWSQVTSMLAANIIDPLAFVPLIKGIPLISKTGRVLSGAAQGTALGAGAGITREAILQHSQETRSVNESLINVLSESAFGGILGASVGALTKAPVRAAGKSILANALKGTDGYSVKVAENGALNVQLSAGAQETASTIEKEGLAHINETFAKAISGPEGLRSPSLRGVTSPSEIIRKFTNRTFNHNFILNKETEGVARGDIAELLIRQGDATSIQINSAANKAYLEYAEVGSIRAGISGLRPEGKISFKEFNERISKGLRDENYSDDIAQVNNSVKSYRTELDNLGRQLKELKLLPEDIGDSQMRNYLTRIYDHKKLAVPEARAAFRSKVSNWLMTRNKDGSVRTKPLEEHVASDQADDILNKILNKTDSQVALRGVLEDVISKGKFTKERSLLIPDSELEEFLVNDAQQLFTHYHRRATSLIQAQKSLNDLGFENLNDMKTSILEEGKRAAIGKTGQEFVDIEKAFNKQAELADDMYRAVTGNLRKPSKHDRFFETLLQYQFVTKLGGVTISSLQEMFMAPFRLGFKNTFMDGYLPMLRDFKTSKLAKDQLKDLDVGLELEMNNTLRALADNDIELGRAQTAYDRTMNAMTDVFGKASGISYFTAFGRRMGAQVAAADIVRSMRASTKGVSAKEVTRLANIGIGKKDYDKILTQIDKHAVNVKGSHMLNLENWDDLESANIVKQAIQNQVESIVIKPGAGDIPFFAQRSQIGRVIFQFKSFMSAATGKVTISGLQRRDMTTLMGLQGLLFAAAASGAIKDMIAGREVKTDFDDILLDAVSRSGVLGLISTAALDMTANLASPERRRYSGRFMEGQVFGPSIGMIEDTTDIISRISDGKVTRNDSKKIERMIPFNNLFYIQFLINKAFGDGRRS